MDSKVIVLADEATGTVINVSENNPEYGYVKLQQVRNVIDDNGFLRRKPVNALLPGTVEDLKSLNLFAGQAMTGKIVIEEGLDPFNAKTPERDLKIAGSTGIVCTWQGLPIYRRTKFTFDANQEDTYLKHDNVDELRAAYANSIKSNSSAIQNAAGQDFSIEG
jgi:hypothetical protein